MTTIRAHYNRPVNSAKLSQPPVLTRTQTQRQRSRRVEIPLARKRMQSPHSIKDSGVQEATGSCAALCACGRKKPRGLAIGADSRSISALSLYSPSFLRSCLPLMGLLASVVAPKRRQQPHSATASSFIVQEACDNRHFFLRLVFRIRMYVLI